MSFEVTAIISLIGGAGASIGALLTALWKLLSTNKKRKININNSQGVKLTIPSNISFEKLDELIVKLKELDSDKFRIELETDNPDKLSENIEKLGFDKVKIVKK